MKGTGKNRKLIDYIKEYLLDNWENEEVSIAEIRRYKENFRKEAGYNLYAYGCILPYYYQIRELYESLGYKTVKSWSNSRLQAHFEYNIKVAVDELIEEDKRK